MILICGDIHQDYKPIRNIYYKLLENNHKPTEKDVIIFLGDFSANFFFNNPQLAYRDTNFKKKIKNYNFTYFVIRGNHEERPSFRMKAEPNNWHYEEFWGNQVYVENAYPYIKYALDFPAKYEIPLENKMLQTLIFPGAYSIDKYYRIKTGKTWFEHEQLTKEEMQLGTELAQMQEWDLVLSHTCPNFYEPTDLFLSTIDQSTVDKTTERWLNQIEFKLKYKLWCWGHFHATRIYPKTNNSERIMLSNDYIFYLNTYFNTNSNPYDNLIKII